MHNDYQLDNPVDIQTDDTYCLGNNFRLFRMQQELKYNNNLINTNSLGFNISSFILRTHSISLPPVNPAGQEQCLTWLNTLQFAFNPHAPCRSHGLLHWPCKHCSERLHSASDWQDAIYI